MPPKAPIVTPIQDSSVPDQQTPGPSTVSGSSGAAVHPSPVVDEGRASSTVPPSAAQGTLDALRGQGNSAAPEASLSREDQAPVARAQRDAAVGGEGVEGKAGTGGERFDVREEGKEGEPTVGKPTADRNSDANLVEAGTTMAGDAGAYSGIEDGDERNGATEGGMRAKMEPRPKL
ncbi:hypothetical protein JCM10450v2_005813 [Rhodotorula kratochvilovae]